MTNDERKGVNESAFREHNERLEDEALESRWPDARFEAVCECSREGCRELIEISVSDYEAVRSSPTAFVLRPGHADPSCEKVVSSALNYEVVEKFGGAGLVAELGDPRED